MGTRQSASVVGHVIDAAARAMALAACWARDRWARTKTHDQHVWLYVDGIVAFAGYVPIPAAYGIDGRSVIVGRPGRRRGLLAPCLHWDVRGSDWRRGRSPICHGLRGGAAVKTSRYMASWHVLRSVSRTRRVRSVPG